MSKKIAVDQSTELVMKRMGELIAEIRGQRSLRKIAEPSGIPASQLQYIERGNMTPTAEVYPKLLDTLQPNEKQRADMDQLYMTIRKTPPPDVCELVTNNPDLIQLLRAIGDTVCIITDRIVVDRQLQAAALGMEHKAGLVKVMDEKCSSKALALNFDDLQDVLQDPREAGDATVISKNDIMVPLGSTNGNDCFH